MYIYVLWPLYPGLWAAFPTGKPDIIIMTTLRNLSSEFWGAKNIFAISAEPFPGSALLIEAISSPTTGAVLRSVVTASWGPPAGSKSSTANLWMRSYSDLWWPQEEKKAELLRHDTATNSPDFIWANLKCGFIQTSCVLTPSIITVTGSSHSRS